MSCGESIRSLILPLTGVGEAHNWGVARAAGIRTDRKGAAACWT